MSEQTLEILSTIRNRLAVTIRRTTWSELLFGVLVAVSAGFGAWTAAVAVEAGYWLEPLPRALLFAGALAIPSALFVVFAARPLLATVGVVRRQSDRDVAERIGRRFPEVGDRLANLLDLADGRGSAAPVSMVDGAVRMLGTQVLPVQFESVEDFARPRRAARLCLIPLVLMLGFSLLAPRTFFGASTRLASVGATFERPAPFTLSVSPGNAEVIRGTDLSIDFTASGRRPPSSAAVVFRYEDEERFESTTVEADSGHAFQYAFSNVRRPFRYRVESAEIASPWYEVTVLDRPVVRGLRVSLAYPSYSSLPPRRLEPNVGDVSALAGTRVTVEVGLGAQQLDAAELVFDDDARMSLERDESTGRATFVLRRAGSYRIALSGAGGVENLDPVAYQLNVVPDAPPSIVLISPDPTTNLDGRLSVPVGARILDDFGFTDLTLHYRLAESRYKSASDSFAVLQLPLEDTRALDQYVAYPWLLAETTTLDPVPGDVVEYFLRVRDNDSWAGLKSAESERYKLVVPSLADRYRALDQQQESAREAIDDILNEAESIRAQFDELRNELRRNQEGSWDNQRQLEHLEQRQQEVEERVEQLGSQLQEMTDEMRRNDLVSEETVAMYDELQKVVEEINSPELREAMQRLQEAMNQLDLQQLQQSLDDFSFNEQQYRDRLERTLELFKRLRVEQQLDEAARRAEELARREEELSQLTERLRQDADGEPLQEESKEAGSESENAEQSTDANEGDRDQEGRSSDQAQNAERQETTAEDLAREQERAREDTESLLEHLRRSDEQMRELRNQENGLQELMDSMQPDRLPKQMEENAQQLREQDLQKAQQGQQQMSEQLQQMSNRLRDMQESMAGMSMNINLAGLRQALQDVLTLSQRQEDSRKAVQELVQDSPRIREYAQEQVDLADRLSTVADSLQRLSREIPQMSRAIQQFTGEALREMSQATEALADRNARVGSLHQQGSMMRLNELALLLADLLNQMMSGQGGGGTQSMQQMLEQLQQMAGEQEQLNQQIQQYLNDAQGNRLSSDAEQRLQQMARQQAQIREELRDMSRNSESRGKLLSDLNRIAEQMEETIEELRNSRADRRTIERQQQILTRLLEAQKSLQNRGTEERREGRSGSDIPQDSPASLPASEEAERLRQELLRALEAGYAPEYQELIKRYFDLLQRQSDPATN